jgi:16S rRNA (uracil1498-N3)-methyltransferase
MAEQRRLLINPDRIGDFIQTLDLSPEECHYLQKVLRLKPGASFSICDGKGNTYNAKLSAEGKANLINKDLKIKSPKPLLHLLFGLFRRDLEVMLRMATELEVDYLEPLQAEYSLLEPGGNRQERWGKILKEAMEQSERAWLPQLSRPQSTSEVFSKTSKPGICRWIAVSREVDAVPLTQILQTETSKTALQWHLACGPEGGWSKAERELAREGGWLAVSLGSSILRCSTAAICGLSLMQHQRNLFNGESLLPSP